MVETNVILDRVRKAAEKVSIGDNLRQALREYGNCQRERARHTWKYAFLVLEICQRISDRPALYFAS